MSGHWPGRYAATPMGDDLEALWGFDDYALNPTRSRMASTPRSLSFNLVPSDRDRGRPPQPPWPTEERVSAVPSGLAGSRASQTPVPRYVVLEDVNPWRAQVAATIPEPPSPQRSTGQWSPPTQARAVDDSRLTPDEQKATLKKLKKEIYNPTPRKFSRRVSLYYRDRARDGSLTRNIGHDDDDGKRCAVCLEDFEPKEEVTMTPCDHMFHEECIVPWVKSHGQCPVCRSVFCDRLKQNESSYNNNNGRTLVGNDLLITEEIASMIRLMEEAIRGGRIGR